MRKNQKYYSSSINNKSLSHSVFFVGFTYTSFVIIMVIFLVFFLPVHGMAIENNNQPLEIGYVEFSPYTFTNDQGKPDGLFLDVAAKVFNNAGLKWYATSYPARRLFRNIVKGYTQVFIGINTIPDFQGKTLVSKYIMGTIELRCYSIGGKKRLYVNNDFKNKSIVIIRGYGYGGLVNFIKDPANNIKFLQANDHVTAFEMLTRERAEYLLDYSLPADKLLAKKIIRNLSYSIVSNLKCYFVLSKELASADKIMQKIDNSFRYLYIK